MLAKVSMQGQKLGKMKFMKYSVSKLVIQALLASHEHATEKSVESVLGLLFKYAPDRKGAGGRLLAEQ